MYKYSNFKAIGFDIWVSFDYLLSKNVPKGTIENGKSNFLKKGSGKWKHIKDQLTEMIFFDLKSIPKQTFKKYKLDNYEEIIGNYGMDIFDNEDDLRIFEKKQFLVQVFSIVAKNKWNLYTNLYNQFYPNFSLINLLGSTHAVLKEIIMLSDEGYPLRLIFDAYKSIPVSTKLYFRTNSYDVFCRKIRFCKLHTIESVLPHKGLSKASNNLKLTEYWCNRVITLYSNKSKMSKTKVQKTINQERMERGLSLITYSTINQFINQPAIKNIVMKSRHGQRVFQNQQQPYLTMTSVSSNEIWEIDGLKIPFCCELSDGPEFLDMVIIIDVFSKRIIGHSIGRNENTELIIKALRNAINNLSFLPKEIVHDRYSPYFSNEIQGLKDKMTLLQVNWRSTKGDKPREKGTIERVIGTLNTKYFRNLYGYIGEGIKSRREDSLPSVEAIKEYRKKDNLYSLNQLSVLIDETIKEYNSDFIGGKPSPDSFYSQSISLNTIVQNKINQEDFAYLFFEEGENKIRNSMVTLSRNNVRFNYTLPVELRNKLNGTKVKVYYNSLNYELIHLFSKKKEKEFFCTIEQDMKVSRRTETWSKQIGNYVNKRKIEDKVHLKSISDFLDNAKSQSLSLQKNATKYSRRFLIEGIDDKEIHKEIIASNLLISNQDDVDEFSLNVIRKKLDEIF